MLGKLIAEIAIYALKSKRLTSDDKAIVMAQLLANLGAIPTKSVIHFDAKGALLVNGRALSMEHLGIFIESCKGLKESFARKLIRDQITFAAIEMGVHKGLNPDMILFSKAALWVIQEEESLINSICEY